MSSQLDSGDTAWMMTSCALVFIMTPGLAFFYGGLINSKNVLNTLMMCYIAIAIITIQWITIGFSFSFSRGDKYGVFGDFKWGGLVHVGQNPYPPLGPTISLQNYMLFQLMFAIITPAIICGAIVGRMRFIAWVIFILLWTTICYDMLAHWVWSEIGWLRALGTLDFAGGTVVHISSGWSALVAAIIVGKRKDVETPLRPHNMPFVLLGAALLWFGWFGFNAGSAVASNGLAVLAFCNTHICAAAAMFGWCFLEAIFCRGRVTPSGAAVGLVVGLVVITPAAGYVEAIIALPMGVIGSIIVYGVMEFKKRAPFFKNIDDTLDSWACHGVGGVVGSILTGVFATTSVNSAGADGLFYNSGAGGIKLVGLQVLACTVAIVLTSVTTAIFLIILKYIPFLGLVEELEDPNGMDTIHGEAKAYDLGIMPGLGGEEKDEKKTNPV